MTTKLPYMVRCTGILLVFCVFFSEWLDRYTDIDSLAGSMPDFTYEIFQMFLTTSGMLLLVVVVFALFEYVTVDALSKGMGEADGAFPTSFEELGQRAVKVLSGAMSVRVSSLWLSESKALAVYAGAFFVALLAAVAANAWVLLRSGRWNEVVQAADEGSGDGEGDLVDVVPEADKRTPEYARLSASSVRCVLAFQLAITTGGLLWYCVTSGTA